jgi:hypothetical protein
VLSEFEDLGDGGGGDAVVERHVADWMCATSRLEVCDDLAHLELVEGDEIGRGAGPSHLGAGFGCLLGLEEDQ